MFDFSRQWRRRLLVAKILCSCSFVLPPANADNDPKALWADGVEQCNLRYLNRALALDFRPTQADLETLFERAVVQGERYVLQWIQNDENRAFTLLGITDERLRWGAMESVFRLNYDILEILLNYEAFPHHDANLLRHLFVHVARYATLAQLQDFYTRFVDLLGDPDGELARAVYLLFYEAAIAADNSAMLDWIASLPFSLTDTTRQELLALAYDQGRGVAAGWLISYNYAHHFTVDNSQANNTALVDVQLPLHQAGGEEIRRPQGREELPEGGNNDGRVPVRIYPDSRSF